MKVNQDLIFSIIVVSFFLMIMIILSLFIEKNKIIDCNSSLIIFFSSNETVEENLQWFFRVNKDCKKYFTSLNKYQNLEE